MEAVTIYVKNKEDIQFLYKVLEYFDFVVLPEKQATEQVEESYDFFASAGIWRNREITQEDLRAKAWKRS